MMDLPSRFLEKFCEGGPGYAGTLCWNWTGTQKARGYAQFWESGKRWYAHIYSYVKVNGKVQAGLELDHLCRRPLCVNPFHLEAVSHAENVRRGDLYAVNGLKTHRANEHEFTEENTGRRKRPGGGRYCRACKRDAERRRRGAKKAV